MKNFFTAALFISALSLQAQVGTSPRTLTRRIEPQLRPQPPAAARPGAGAAAPGIAAPKTPPTAAELEQQKMEQSIEEKKKLQWQTERAEKGSDTAQLALGLRYLEGKGINKDPKKARKWLEAAAKQGNADARKALAEHPELPPPDPVQSTEKPVQPTFQPLQPAQNAVTKR
ncbi:MAG TPA: SEL1-like repeat protein [Verrucomicrobiae bacterium]|nr:SEL1-like repeat protein [Verrucomicrobiae bacterium]